MGRPGDDSDDIKVDGRTARAERRRAETQARILDAACTCFATDGYHRTSVDDIIGRAGIARGTFYLYFEGKRVVLEALLGQLLQDIDERVHPISLDRPEPPRTQLEANLQRAWDVLAGNPRMAQVVLGGLHGVDPEFDAQVAVLEENLLAMIERSITAGQAIGWLRSFDPRMAACSLIGAFKENLRDVLFRGERSDGDAPHPDHGDRVAQMLEVLLLGAAEEPLLQRGDG